MRFCADLLQSNLHLDLESVIDTNLSGWSFDDSPQQVACYRLKESLLKKFNNAERPSTVACDAALKKFLVVNHTMGEWKYQPSHDWEAELLTEFKNEVYKFWYVDPLRTEPLIEDLLPVFLAGRTGPGASLLASGEDFYRKVFSSTLTATQGVPDIWELCVSRCPQFREAFCDPLVIGGTQTVDHNKMSFVNKTVQIARTICTEPTINMWFQLGIGEILHRRLGERYGIDFGIQPKVNAELAKFGSINGQLVTLDLESASDSLSLGMLRWALPKSFMALLSRFRSPASRLPDGSLVELNMVSTMGNGFTFPLQTMVFSSAVRATYSYLRKSGLNVPDCRFNFDKTLRRHNGLATCNASVFGDDIIVHSSISRHLIRLLNLLGFCVNSTKSFIEGPFRESCGSDYFSGQAVRPLYLKRLRTLQDSFVAINGLNRWSANHGVLLRNTVQYILACFPYARRCPVPLDEDDSAGLSLPMCTLTTAVKQVKGVLGLFHYSASVPSFFGYKIKENGTFDGAGDDVVFNPRGLEIAFIQGCIRGYRSGDGETHHRVSLRQRETRYITKRRVTPRWDYLPPHKRLNPCHSGVGLDVARLQWACLGNL